MPSTHRKNGAKRCRIGRTAERNAHAAHKMHPICDQAYLVAQKAELTHSLFQALVLVTEDASDTPASSRKASARSCSTSGKLIFASSQHRSPEVLQLRAQAFRDDAGATAASSVTSTSTWNKEPVHSAFWATRYAWSQIACISCTACAFFLSLGQFCVFFLRYFADRTGVHVRGLPSERSGSNRLSIAENDGIH